MPGTGISIGRGTMPRDLLGYDPDRDRAVYSGIDDKGQTRQMFESRMWLGLAQFEGGAHQFYRRSTLMLQGCTCCSRRAKGPRALRYWALYRASMLSR